MAIAAETTEKTGKTRKVQAKSAELACWICQSKSFSQHKPANLPAYLSAEAFQITDSAYGSTGEILKCETCGFLQCPHMDDVLSFYEDMDDGGYEDTRAERALQARRLVRTIAKHRPEGRLLDVGAGSGILIEEAQKDGFEAEGVEPSIALQERASELGLPVYRGVLPHKKATGPYDLVTIVDVIEHVDDPVGLMRSVADVMDDDGVCLVVTPDVHSLAARLMGLRWWHYRIAHIGYFNKETLAKTMAAAGLEIIETRRPSWYFPLSYLAVRAMSYLPRWLRLPVPKFLDRIVVPLNLFDSLLVICRKVRT